MTRTARAVVVALGLLGWAGPASALTFYVQPAGSGGSDARSCATAQTIGTPKATIASGVTCLSAGDTLFLRSGTYTEKLEWFGTPFITQGTSWGTAVTIGAYQNESVTIKGPAAADWVVLFRGSGSGATNAPKYVIFDKIIFDGTALANSSNQLIGIRAWDNTTNPADAPAHHIRFQHGRITGSPHAQGILITWGSDGVELIDMEVDHIGGPTTVPNNTQGIYGAANGLLVDGCRFHDNWGYGISNISSVSGQDNSDQIIRNNVVYNNGTGGTGLGGINLGEGTGNQIYNNVVYGNAGPGILLRFGAGSAGTVIYNNTVYNNTGIGIGIGPAETTAVVRNNISYLNGTNYQDLGSGTTHDHNLEGTNPGFVNAAGGDFKLSSITSPAVDVGLTIALTATDILGNTRPAGAAYDYGAYEYAGTGGGGDVDTPATGTIFVTDSFTGAATTAWASHTGETGATWAVHPNGNTGPVLSNANRLRSNSTPGNTFHYASGTPVSAEYDVTADFVFFTQLTGSAYQVLARVATGAESFYIGNYNVDTGRAELEVALAGSYNELGSCARTIADGTTMRIRLEIRDAIKKLYTLIVGTDVAFQFCTSSTDNTVTAAGKAGAAIYSSTTAGSNSTDVHIDNFEARDVQTAASSANTKPRLRFVR